MNKALLGLFAGFVVFAIDIQPVNAQRQVGFVAGVNFSDIASRYFEQTNTRMADVIPAAKQKGNLS